MGASVYNDELKKELALLDDLLANRIEATQLMAVKKALKEGRLNEQVHKEIIHSPLAALLLTLPELIHQHEPLSQNKKLWFKAKLFFLRRRFIEAATLLSEVLKAEPQFVQARNWRARAIFFLGNLDLAISELDHIINNSSSNSPDHLEALYLKGAIVYESNDSNSHRLSTGIKAWKEYLNRAETTANLRQEIDMGLRELAQRQKGETTPTALFDPFAPSEKLNPEKNAIFSAFKKEELLLALELCEAALKKAYDVDISLIKARIFIKTGRIDEASDLFTQIVERNDRYAPAFHYRGMAFMMKGLIKEAISSWQKTAELDPAYAQAHNLAQRIGRAQKMIEPTPIETH